MLFLFGLDGLIGICPNVCTHHGGINRFIKKVQRRNRHTVILKSDQKQETEVNMRAVTKAKRCWVDYY